MMTGTMVHVDAIEDCLRLMRCTTPDDLARVGEAVLAAEHADHLLVQVVREARQAGRSWAEIGAVLGARAVPARHRVGNAVLGPGLAREAGERFVPVLERAR